MCRGRIIKIFGNVKNYVLVCSQSLMGLICGAVFGVTGESMLGKWREKRKKGDDDSGD